jgi:hypothetical protein
MAAKLNWRRYFWMVFVILMAACGTLAQDNTGSATHPGPSPSPDIEMTATAFASLLKFPTHIVETRTARPTVPPTATSSLQPPSCTFPLAQTTSKESIPEEYSFSEPQVVLTNVQAILHLIEWLPDNQQILLARDNLNDQSRINDQTLELFAPLTGTAQEYATRKTTLDNPPAWVANPNAVVYPETTLLSSTISNGMRRPPYVIQRQLWVSRGDPAHAQLLEDAQQTVDHISAFSVVAKPDDGEIAYFNNQDKQLYRQKASKGAFEALPPVSFDPIQWGAPLVSLQMVWRPGTSQVFVYNFSNSRSLPSHTFLLDTDSGQACGVDMFANNVEHDNSVVLARWSQDGRYLAVIIWDAFQEPNSLVILDTTNGKLYEMRAEALTPPETDGLRRINDLAWAPDNQHLVALTQVLDLSLAQTVDQSYFKFSGLYLADFLSGQAIPISSPTQKFGSSFGKTNLLWSDDGLQLLVNCASDGVDKLCLLSVQKKVQP